MTTIVLVRKHNEVVVAGDGQVSMGNTVIKSTAAKVRKIEKRNVIAGFAGSTADALTLFERLESKLEKHAGNLSRAAVELAKDWRTDKYLRRLEALMAIGDKENSFIISGTGDVLEPEGDAIGIGSGGNYALAAAKVLLDTDLSAEDIAKKSIKIASEICVFTNDNIKIEKRDVVAGFAGSTADALTLFERLEAKIEKHAGNLSRAAVELAKDWRTDKYLRRLEALMAIGDKKNSYIISGTGDVLEPEGDVIGIGSGGNYALAAGKVLMETDKSAEEIAKKAIKIASEICVFTNDNIKVLKISWKIQT